MSDLKNRVSEYCNIKNIAISAFEKSAGLSNGYFNQVKKRPSLEKIESIKIAFPDLNTDWLLTGHGPILRANETLSISNFQTSGRDSVFNGAPSTEQTVTLRTEIEYLKKILEEKERTIQLLMKAAGNNL